MAASYLRAHGYTIEAVNWRGQSYELDLVARKGPCLAFVEVKCSRGEDFGPPEARVGKIKRRRLAIAADEYMAGLECPPEEIRFDIISIFWPRGQSPQITHMEGAFFLDEEDEI